MYEFKVFLDDEKVMERVILVIPGKPADGRLILLNMLGETKIFEDTRTLEVDGYLKTIKIKKSGDAPHVAEARRW